MVINTIKCLRYLFVSLIGISLIASCQQEVQLKPWDSTSLGKVELTFTDTDKQEGEIAGSIELELPAELKPQGVVNYVIYWSESGETAGKGEKLAEVSANLSGSLLYDVPEDTLIPEEKGSYFLLYLKGSNNQEVWSGKTTAVDDLIVKEDDKDKPKDTTDVKPKEDVEKPKDVVEKPKDDVVVEKPKTEADVPVVVKDKPDVDVDKDVEKDTVKDTDKGDTLEPVVITIENVLFEFDRSYLRPEFKETLRVDFAEAEDKDQMEILIAGHADERGSNEYNLALGERRAYAVKRFLVSLGFTSDNVRIISYGEEKPLDRGHSEAAWSKNRRSETKVLNQDD